MWNTYASSSHVGAGNGRIALILSPVDIRGNVSRQGEPGFLPVAVRESVGDHGHRVFSRAAYAPSLSRVASLSLILLASRAVLFLLDHLIACRNSECPSRLRISMFGMTQWPPMIPGKYFTGGKNVISSKIE